MSLKITILGCGNSTGVPSIGNHWGKCDPHEPRNNRLRSSIAVQSESTTIIVDTGPDFRAQMNRADISHLDAVLYTHAHSDHIMGIDDLRMIRIRGNKLVPVYGNAATLADLTGRFKYLFEGGKSVLYPPVLQAHEIRANSYGKSMKVGDIDFIPFDQDHGTCRSVGYRFGDLGYSCDIVNLDKAAITTLAGIKTWIVDGAGYHHQDNVVHANLETIYRLNEKIGAAQVYLSSLTLAMDYQTLVNELPDGYAPAYDGLKITAMI